MGRKRHAVGTVAVAALAVAMLALPASAITYTWDGGDGVAPITQNWSTAENWNPDGAPTSVNTTTIVFDGNNNMGTNAARLNQDIATLFVLNRLVSGNAPAPDKPVYLGGNQLQFVADGATQPTIHGNRDQSTFIGNAIDIPTGTTLTVTNRTYQLYFQAVISGPGALTINGTGLGGGEMQLHNGGNSYAGGTHYIHSGGNAQWSRLRVYASGALGAASGDVTLQGGNLNPYHGTTNKQPGGLAFYNTTTHANDFKLLADSPIFAGDANTAGANVTLSGDVDLNNNTLYLRGGGTGTIGGQITSTGGPGGLVKMDTGTWTLSGANTYDGVTTVQAGTLKLGNASALGAATNGTVVQSGATLDLGGAYASTSSNEAITVSGSGVGGLGAIVNTGAGINNRGFGNVTLAGDTTFGGSVRWDLRSGATFSGNSHTLTKAGTFQMAVTRAMNDVNIIINQGMITIQNSNAVGGTTFGNTVVNSGGTLNYYGTYTVPETIILNGGTLGSLRFDTTFSGPVTLNADSTMSTATGGHDMTISGPIDGSAGFTKTGGSDLILTDTNTYSGTTDILEGKLLVNGKHTGVGMYTVHDGATLGGTGLITTAPVTVEEGGTIAPGTSTGELGIGSVVFEPESFFDVQINNNIDFDVLTMGGSATLAGTLVLYTPPGFDPPFCKEFVVLTADQLFGEFDAFDTSDVNFASPAMGWEIVYDRTPDAAKVTLHVVPEPATLTLFGLGALGVLVRRRRK